jgi:hypothetical protein
MVAIHNGPAMTTVHVRRKVTGKLTPDRTLHAPRDGSITALASDGDH